MRSFKGWSLHIIFYVQGNKKNNSNAIMYFSKLQSPILHNFCKTEVHFKIPEPLKSKESGLFRWVCYAQSGFLVANLADPEERWSSSIECFILYVFIWATLM